MTSTYDCGCDIMPCGCEQLDCPNGGYDIVYCSTHAAAPAMLEALKLIRDTADDAQGCEDYQTYDDVLGDIACRLAESAIIKAKGE